ncbi:MAG: hypothetical protein BWZ10_00943 [candidate division BRC1 bacterium ADurb.BinA364]|nr:MAG: hypothetical protein BWZ10_00943 [candidate division BRC1 bacterium ADurb.BinA364]
MIPCRPSVITSSAPVSSRISALRLLRIRRDNAIVGRITSGSSASSMRDRGMLMHSSTANSTAALTGSMMRVEVSITIICCS